MVASSLHKVAFVALLGIAPTTSADGRRCAIRPTVFERPSSLSTWKVIHYSELRVGRYTTRNASLVVTLLPFTELLRLMLSDRVQSRGYEQRLTAAQRSIRGGTDLLTQGISHKAKMPTSPDPKPYCDHAAARWRDRRLRFAILGSNNCSSHSSLVSSLKSG